MLTKNQKKFIKKNVREMDINEIATSINVSKIEILDFLKERWGDEKFSKFTSNNDLLNDTKNKSKLLFDTTNFSFKNWIKENFFGLIFVIILILVAYVNSLNNGFVSDDVDGILKNKNIGNLQYALNQPFLSFRLISNWAIFSLFGATPIAFRVFNLFFHIGSVIAIYFLFSLMKRKNLALFMSSIFAVHPVLIESITWISGGPYSNYTFFILLSFIFYIFSKESKKYLIPSVFFYLLSLSVSIFSAAIFFLILIWYELCFGDLKKNYLKIVPFLILSLIVGVFFVKPLFTARETSFTTTHYQQQVMEQNFDYLPLAITTYLRLIFYPDNLSLYRPEVIMNSQLEYFIRYLLFFSYFYLIYIAYKKNKMFAFWLGFFILSLLPFLTPFRLTWVVAERYVYLGSIGIIFFIAYFFDRLCDFEKQKTIIYFLFLMVVMGFLTRTIIRNQDWKDVDTLYLSLGKTSPYDPKTHNNIGDVYSRRKEYDKAEKAFKRALELKPNYGDAYHNLANIYAVTGKFDLAIENYNKALSLNPNIWQSYYALAAIYSKLNDQVKAKEYYLKAKSINKDIP